MRLKEEINEQKTYQTTVTTGSTSIAPFATVIGATIGITSVSFSPVFSISTVIVKEILIKTRNKTKKLNKIVMWARSKLNSLKSKISEVLTNNEIGHEDFIKIINDKKGYQKLKESVRMMKSQRSDNEKNIWLKRVKK